MRRLLPLLFFCSIALAGFSQKSKTRLNHTAIFVVNCQKSAAFYQNIIGLDTIPEPFHDGKHVWLSMGSGMALHIIEGALQPKEYFKNQHTCFSVASINDFTKILQQQRIPFEDVSGKKGAITTRIDGVHQIWLQDPDGYWLEVNDAKE